MLSSTTAYMACLQLLAWADYNEDAIHGQTIMKIHGYEASRPHRYDEGRSMLRLREAVKICAEQHGLDSNSRMEDQVHHVATSV